MTAPEQPRISLLGTTAILFEAPGTFDLSHQRRIWALAATASKWPGIREAIPGITNLMLVVGLWNLINVIKAGAALGVTAERRQVEATPSLAVDRQAVLTLNGLAIDVRVERVSAERCRLRMDAIVPMRRSDDSSTGSLAIVPLQESQGASGTWPTIPVLLSGSATFRFEKAKVL